MAAGSIPELIDELDANTRRVNALVGGLTNAQFNWRPEQGRWSIGQALGHLCVVNGGDLAPLRESVERGRAQKMEARGPFVYGLFSRKFIASMEPPAIRKFKAPKYYLPPPDADVKRTAAEYLRVSAEVRQIMESARGLDLVRVKATLPALPALLRKVIKMPLGGRFALLTTHDRRHLWQGEQVRKHPAFPAR